MNKRVLCIGIATLDVVNVVQDYPQEDAEVRALDQHFRRGGNSANTAVVIAQFGHHVSWLGNLADDTNVQFITADLDAFGVDYSLAPVIGDSATPTSYIAQSRATGSRTIVHYRKLPELQQNHLPSISWSDFDWVHVEGRNETQTLLLLQAIRALPESQRPRISLEIEKIRQTESQLIPFADVIFFSRDYVQQKGFSNASAFIHAQKAGVGQTFVIPWGNQGAYAFASQQVFFSPALSVDKVVDSIGAGDSFIAGFVHAQLSAQDVHHSLDFANAIAARKIQQQGFANLAI